MDKNQHIKVIILLLLTFCLNACEEMILGPQPNFLEDPEHEPMLNIMGVLRPDSLQSYPMTFIQLEKTVKVPYDTSESEDVYGASVEVYRLENNEWVDTVIFELSRFQGIFTDSVYRPLHFYPKEGDTYRVECRYENLPVLTSETTIPPVPQIAGDTIYIQPQSIDFSIIYDSIVTMYDVAILINNELFDLYRFY